MKTLLRFTTVFVAVMAFCVLSFGQVSSTGSLSGTVIDPNGATVAGASVVVKNNATAQEFPTQTNDDGFFRVPSLNTGTYTATITAPGFKQSVVKEIKVDVGLTSSINVALEVGVQTEQVTVVGGGELLRTENATVGTTLTGRQITDIPTASRDALDLVLALPGTATPGRPRTSTVNGLPKGALNISLDGVNVQDNLLKSSDGFFTYIRPRTDAISEVTVSTSNPGAESASEGAVQIKFVTQGGSNDFHGGVYWYHRNPRLNANYWFNNRNLAPDPRTGEAPHNRILLNQFGGKVGGPIIIPGLFNGRDRAFFFVNYEEFRLPENFSRTRTILSPDAQTGTFRYAVGPAGSQTIVTRNLFDIAAAADCDPNTPGQQPCPSTADPTISALLGQIRSAVSGQLIRPLDAATGFLPDPNRQQVSFVNIGGQTRYFPTVRFDFNITKNHHLENIWNYQAFRSVVDFLNGVDPSFPGFPNFGSQDSNRFSNVIALRSTLRPNIVNEARFGLTGGTVLFFPQVNSGQFQNQGGFNLGIGAAGITGATIVNNTQRRNTPVKQFYDTLTWVKGSHSFSFGGNITKVNFFQQLFTPVVANIGFGVTQGLDPAFNAMFTSGNFPNSTLGQRQQAAALYAVLTGRMASVGRNARLDEDTAKYKVLGDLVSRAEQTEFGIFGQDTWRIRSNLTLNYGLRYEVQLPFKPLNRTYSFTSFEGLFGESGPGNIFKPGVLQGSPTIYNEYTPGTEAYDTDYSNFAPSFGFAYSPNFENAIMRRIFGNSGQTVLRGGFSMAFTREGVNTFQSIFSFNPGGTIDATVSTALGTLPVGSLFRNGVPGPPVVQETPNYPNRFRIIDSANAFSPNLDVGYVGSWTFGIQRELTQNTALEVRYVGNRGHKLWRQYDLNEVNVLENGFLNEFRRAQANLLANINAGRGQTFAYTGVPGTSPLPIMLANFQGPVVGTVNTDPNNPNHYVSPFFADGGFVFALHPLAPNAFGIANALAFNSREVPSTNPAILQALLNRRALWATTNHPLRQFGAPNFFLVNPSKLGGAFIIDNGGQSWYDALTIELRRRLAKGLLVQGSYTFSKSLTNMYASSSAVFSQYHTLRNPGLNKVESPFDLTHAFKVNFIYELPIGRGRAIFGDANRWVDDIIGGWGFNGNIRWQSGSPFAFGNVQLVGMTKEELQKAIKIRKGGSQVFYLPDDIITNTSRAFDIFFNTAGQPDYRSGAPTGRFIAPAGYGNCIQGHTGQCGFANLVLKGPMFFRADLSVVKKIKFTERVNLEMRGEFLNAFNNVNFLVGNPAADVNGGPLSGIVNNAYQDLSTTNDPGGRLVQLVIRINF